MDDTLLDEAIKLAERGEPLKGPKLVAWLKDLQERRVPIPMILFCPMCHTRHVDKGDFATRPHHTHACQNCGLTWRPAINTTVGVQHLPGFKDEE